MLSLTCLQHCQVLLVICILWQLSWLTYRRLLGCRSAKRSTSEKCCTRDSCRSDKGGEYFAVLLAAIDTMAVVSVFASSKGGHIDRSGLPTLESCCSCALCLPHQSHT